MRAQFIRKRQRAHKYSSVLLDSSLLSSSTVRYPVKSFRPGERVASLAPFAASSLSARRIFHPVSSRSRGCFSHSHFGRVRESTLFYIDIYIPPPPFDNSERDHHPRDKILKIKSRWESSNVVGGTSVKGKGEVTGTFNLFCQPVYTELIIRGTLCIDLRWSCR